VRPVKALRQEKLISTEPQTPPYNTLRGRGRGRGGGGGRRRRTVTKGSCRCEFKIWISIHYMFIKKYAIIIKFNV
jgi:hypothetical protein